MSDALVHLDGTASAVTYSMLAVALNPATMPAEFEPTYQPGDELWSYRVPQTDEFGVLLLRQGKVAASLDPSPAPAPAATPEMPKPPTSAPSRPTE